MNASFPESLIPDRALSTAQRVAAQMPSEGLFSGLSWRISPEPFLLPSSLTKELEKLGYRLQKFLRAADLLYCQSVKGTMPAWIAELLDAGKPSEVVALGRDRAFRGQLPSVIRPDIIPTSEGYILSEIDSVPGGIGLTALLNQVYAKEGFSVLGGAQGMLTGFASILPEGGDIYVSQEAATYRPEMAWLAARLQETTGQVYQVRGQEDFSPWEKNTYRFFELFDLSQLPNIGNLWDAVKNQRITLTAPPKAYLEEKLWFALFWLKPLENFWKRELGGGVWAALRRCIPRSWILNPAPLPPQAVYPYLDINSWEELKLFSQKQRQLLIKISGFSEFAWGARGVTVGHDVSSPDWKVAIERALDSYPQQPYILQEFHHGAQFPARYWDASSNQLQEMSARARICPYYFSSEQGIQLGGALATLCPADKKLLHGMTDAILCPVVGV